MGRSAGLTMRDQSLDQRPSQTGPAASPHSGSTRAGENGRGCSRFKRAMTVRTRARAGQAPPDTPTPCPAAKRRSLRAASSEVRSHPSEKLSATTNPASGIPTPAPKNQSNTKGAPGASARPARPRPSAGSVSGTPLNLKIVLSPVMRAVKLLCGLEQFVPPVSSLLPHPAQQSCFFEIRHGPEVPRNGNILPEIFHRPDSHHERRHGKAQGIPQALLGCDGCRRGYPATRRAASQTLHPDHADVVSQANRHDLSLKAAIVRVHHIYRHLRRVPGVILAEHLQVDPGILVPGEANETDLPGFAGLERRFDAAFFKYPIRIVVVNQLVELPKVQMIGTQPAQAVLQAFQRPRVVPIAVLGHQKHLLPPAARCE